MAPTPLSPSVLVSPHFLAFPQVRKQRSQDLPSRVCICCCPLLLGFPRSSIGKKKICLQCRSPRFNSWIREIPWRKKWQPTPIFWPGKSHGPEEPGGLQSRGSQRVVHDLVTKPPALSTNPLIAVAACELPVRWASSPPFNKCRNRLRRVRNFLPLCSRYVLCLCQVPGT